MDPVALARASGGFVTAQGLHAAGCSRRSVSGALQAGGLHRVRRGHYTSLHLDDPRVVAVRVGGRLTGLSAIETRGGWVWRQPALIQVALPPHASRLRPVEGVALHWRSDDEAGGSAPVVSARSALIRVVLDEPLESAVAAIDWALHSGAIDRLDFEAMLLRLPEPARSIRYWVDPASQSVLESVARVRLRSRGWSVRSQARVGEMSSIDLVVEEHVALELDGREFHEHTFDEDREKDLQITIEGRHAIRIGWRIVRDRWSEVELAIETALAARRQGDGGYSGTVPRVPRGSRRHPSALTQSA